MSFLEKVDAINVMSVLELMVLTAEGNLTLPLVLHVVCICIVPMVQNVDSELVERRSLPP